MRMLPQFPMYIVSKGRWESRLTSKAFEKMQIPYFVVVEEQEFEQYASVIDRSKLLILDKKYQRDYDTFDDLGDSKSKGPGPARNFAWEHSISIGARWHWVHDDNISGFCRLNHNKRVPCDSPAIFRAAEDFVDRYENVAVSGLGYRFEGGTHRDKQPPFTLNTRIYSCLLIRNDIPYRWRGRYNEDTDLSVRALKDGWCTVLFRAFRCDKLATQSIKGGNTDAFYASEGTLAKSRMQIAMHPDISKLVWRYGRWHHYVDYSVFSRNELRLKDNVNIPEGINNFGMILMENGRISLTTQLPVVE